MGKTALLLHGWPRPVDKDSAYYKLLRKLGYVIVAPEIFSKDFILSISEAKSYIKNKLKGRTPDVIIGISIGGLLAPHITKDYPNAKIILIATCPRLEPKSVGFKILIDLAKKKGFLNALGVVKFLPKRLLFSFCEAISPFKGKLEDKLIYIYAMKKNIEYIMNIPISKEREIVDFITKTDNTELLKSIKNKTLISAGLNDPIMPQYLSHKLHELLTNSRVIVNHGGHMDIIAEPGFKDMESFLAE
jgi:pimeloyl-ACP methyl ester carboxylesterase